jgi:hypothetical protein
VRERGKAEERYEEKKRRPLYSFEVLYVPTAYFLLPWAKLLPLTNGPKKKDEGWKDEGYYTFSSTLATDGLGSV